MDDTPFLNINLLEIKESDIESLNKLRKENFDKDSLITYAEELVYTSTLNESLRRLFSNPSDDFVRFIVKDFSEMRITSNVIERFRPLVKKAISNAVLDIVSKGLYQQETLTIKKEENINNDSVNRDDLSEIEIGNKVHKGIITTENELKGFNIVKDILEKNNRDISEINYKDTTNYFSVYLRNTTRWIIRFNLDASKKNVMTKLPVEYAKNICLNKEIEQAPKGIGESRVYINSIDELYDLEKYLVDAYDNVN